MRPDIWVPFKDAYELVIPGSLKVSLLNTINYKLSVYVGKTFCVKFQTLYLGAIDRSLHYNIIQPTLKQ